MLRGGDPMPESTECGFVLPLLFIMPLEAVAAGAAPTGPLDVRRPPLLLFMLLLLLLPPPLPAAPAAEATCRSAVDGTEKVLELDDDGD